ncbi:WxL domain-containing protein [Lacticaseibacillus sp. GG6-2]
MPKNSCVAIDKVPNIDFSAAKYSSKAQDVDASSVDTAVSVTNPGFANGWSVSVAATDFVSADDQDQIHSAQLTFDQAAVQSATTATASSDTASTTITTGGDAATLISTNAQSSRGTTTAKYAATAIHLHIPAGNAKADYNANLDWTLSNAVQ